jgi:hypothetical protein
MRRLRQTATGPWAELERETGSNRCANIDTSAVQAEIAAN